MDNKELINEIENTLFKDFIETGEADMMALMDKYTNKVEIEIPGDHLQIEDESKFKALLSSKGPLIKKALGTDTLDFYRQGNMIVFPWFTEDADKDDLAVYQEFVMKMAVHASEAKRISDIYHEPENERYTFRCFLLRLGYIGSDYKDARKVLLRNLTGSAAFRKGH